MTSQLAEPAVTPALAAGHGLTAAEYGLILKRLGRAPTFTELGVLSVMWSEHCSYKSSRRLLATLPTTGDCVLQGPGENAGAISIGDGEAIVFKIESHNHPSAVMPYQGAATGVGGILRDIFTMGARPIAMMNSLRFGDPRDPAVKRLAEGVVRGIGDYGNCVGIPTVGGEAAFDPCYEGNPLVNAMCVGRIRAEKLTLAAARAAGSLVVYFGNTTGRDGVHGATFASVELTEETIEQKSAVQVGDPFMEKKIMEATLELIEAGVLEGIQDMGAAGLTCSSCEMGSRGGLGVRLDLDKVPARAAGLSAYELMLSESQERMLAVCLPERLDAVAAILGKWDLAAHVVGEVTDDGDLTVLYEGREVVRLPNHLLTEEAPLADLKAERPDYLDRVPIYKKPDLAPDGDALRRAALDLLADPNIASKRWIYEQYDTQVMTQTLEGPGGSAAVMRLKGSGKRIAIATDCNGMLCYLDPREGARLAVAEAARNLVCAGATPVAVTNCLNFGNPNKPGIFWQFGEAIAGMGEACRALGTPVTGGNVSFYNESAAGAVFPTPVIGMIGLFAPGARLLRPRFARAGLDLWLLGPDPVTLGGSRHARLTAGHPVGPCPRLDLDVELAVQRLTLELNEGGLIEAAQDVSEGGLFVAAAECAIAGGVGCELLPSPDLIPDDLWLFGEDPSRILLASTPEHGESIYAEARARNLTARRVGQTRGAVLAFESVFEIDIPQLNRVCYAER